MEQKERKTNEAPHNSVLDFNASWPLRFVYLGYLIGIWFGQRSTESFVISNNFSSMSYYLISRLVGIPVTALIYNLGKYFFAKIAGYKLIFVRFLGFLIDCTEEKKKVSFNIRNIRDVAAQYAPKDEDTKKNPSLLFAGGFIAEAILVVAILVIFLAVSITANDRSAAKIAGYTLLFSALFGFVIPLYELLPFRQDKPTDRFNLLVTKSTEDKEAYNIVQINKKKERMGLDYLVPSFKDYESFYKARTLYGTYLSYLYASQLEKANQVLSEMRYLKKFYNDDDRYLEPSESIYLRYLIGDDAGADKIYLTRKSDDKKISRTPVLLSNYRVALEILGFITKNRDEIDKLNQQFKSAVESYKNPSNRVKKEKELYLAAYKDVAKKEEILHLPEFNF